MDSYTIVIGEARKIEYYLDCIKGAGLDDAYNQIKSSCKVVRNLTEHHRSIDHQQLDYIQHTGQFPKIS